MDPFRLAAVNMMDGRVVNLEPCRSTRIYCRLWVACTKSGMNDMSKVVHCPYEVPVNDHIVQGI